MSFPTTSVLDNFNRANEAPLSGGGNWGALSNHSQMTLSSNQVLGVSGQNRHSAWLAGEFPGNAECFASVAARPSSNDSCFVAIHVSDRGQAGWDGYIFQWINTSGGLFRLQQLFDGINIGIVADVGGELNSNEGLGIEIVDGVVTGYATGVSPTASGTWAAISSSQFTETPRMRTLPLLGVGDLYRVPGGTIGIGGFGSSWRFDDFGGGSI